MFVYFSAGLVYPIAATYAVLGILTAEAYRADTKIVANYYDVRKCEDKKSLIIIHNMTYALNDEGGTMFSAVVDFLAPIIQFTKRTVLINRCTGGVGPSTCEYYTRWDWRTLICSMVAAKGMLWTPFAEAFVPHFKCPVPQGLRVLNNASLDVQIVDTMGIHHPENYIWDTETQLYNEKAQLAVCMRVSVSGHRINTKRRGKKPSSR